MKDHLYNLLSQNNFAYSTDTRTLCAGDIFFALSGDNFNGNIFAQQALEKGASYVVIDNTELYIENDDRYLLVDSTYDIFLQLANHHRNQFQIPIIGIAGSNGKTTTKELATEVLKKKYHVLHTPHNDNNNLGVAKTLLLLREYHELVVIELGSNTPGELDRAIHIAEPTHGLVTNIGKEHLEFFGSIEGVAQEECRLYDFLISRGKFSLAPYDDVYIQKYFTEQHVVPTITYGSDVAVSHMTSLSLHLDWRQRMIATHLFGIHNKQNIAAAIALGEIFEVPQNDIISAIQDYLPDNKRSQIVEQGSTTFILDFYNANPSSMQLALESFEHLVTNKKKIVILGDMLEMGEHADTEHRAVVEHVLNMNLGDAFFAGPYFGKLVSKYHHYEKVDSLVTALADYELQDSLVLIKSSKGVLYVHKGFRELLGL